MENNNKKTKRSGDISAAELINDAYRLLPEEQAGAIAVSHEKVFKRAFLLELANMMLVALPLLFVFMSLQNSAPYGFDLPPGATEQKVAHADYDGNFLWTDSSHIYKRPFADFGLNPNDFEPHQNVTIFLSPTNEVIGITPEIFKRETYFSLGIAFVVIIILSHLDLLVLYTYSRQRYGKAWYDWLKLYRDGKIPEAEAEEVKDPLNT